VVERSGSDKSRILQATIWLASMDDFAEMNAVWDAWVDPANPPARACGESRLATPDYTVEIIVVAAAG
jgi:enamine deaminase RidA (YjgF/YER057c/UK114 family)